MDTKNKQLLEALGIDLKRIKTSGKTTCPKCSHERKKKTDPCLSVNITDGTYKCHNCDWKGGVIHKPHKMEKTYEKPVFNNRTVLDENVVKWFLGRGINPQTLIDFRVSSGLHWIPQVKEKRNTIQFNYLRDGELVNIKYRDGNKNFTLVSGAELILYNVDSIKNFEECIICEGEIDAMSWHQAGCTNVVSVPNGASKNAKLEYIENCLEYFSNKKRIYLSIDDDEAGYHLREELARRLGYERCFKVHLDGYKDANEYLVACGDEALRNRLGDSQPYPIAGVFTIEDVEEDINHIYLNGLPEGDKTGDDKFDNHLRFMKGELTMVTGVPQHGKSIFLDQLSLRLAINADWKFGVFSPESFPVSFYYTRLIKRLLGKKFTNRLINNVELNSSIRWIKDRYFVISPEDEGFSLDVILEKARQLVMRKGIKGLILDPWNRIESTMPNGYSEVKWIGEQLIKIVRFSQIHGVHTFLVAHPTKMPKDSDMVNYQIPNLYNISGSANFFNMTQNGFCVFRNFATGKTEIHIQKVKWEHLGKLGVIEYTYCEENARFYAEFEDPYQSWLPAEGVQEEISYPSEPLEITNETAEANF